MRLRGKVDINHNDIIDSLRKIGASVVSLSSIGNGCPDILVGYRRKNYLFEIKSNKKCKLTEDQKSFHRKYNGILYTVTSIDEIINFLKISELL